MKKKVKQAMSSENNTSDSHIVRNGGIYLRNGTVMPNNIDSNGTVYANGNHVKNGYKTFSVDEESRMKVIHNQLTNGGI